MSFFGSRFVSAVAAVLALTGAAALPAQAQGLGASAMRERIDGLIPEFEAYLQAGMESFDVPGAAVGIVHNDKLIYAKGFGVKELGKPDRVNPATIFQIGSTSKAFFSATLAQAVDAGKLEWNDRVSDLLPEFQLSDPWVGRDIRVLDLAAQRSGLTPYVNDGLTGLGYDAMTLVRSLRDAPLTRVFRSDFTYVNITHIAGGIILARKLGMESWSDVVRSGIFEPLGMTSSSSSAEAIEKAPDHAVGHRQDEAATTAIPFHESFPYIHGPAGGINSNVPDVSRWLRMQLGRGHFEDKVIVSEENLDVTWTPRVAINERLSYAIGWVVTATPNGRIVWHNGGTMGFGAHVGFLPDRGVGIVVLTNTQNRGFPDAVAQWVYDRLLGNEAVDNVALALEAARGREAEEREKAAPPAHAPESQDLTAFAGTYMSPLLGDVAVSVEGGRLRLRLEDTEATLTLAPRDEDLFDARLDASGAYAPIAAMMGDEAVTQIRFERDDDGAVTRMDWVAPTLPQTFSRQR
ncbi:serine hydrolase [Microvirga sp. GCM10011540]|uniref:serine hydrolase n=1 Tax=Microvirga sp. GCM10011540 TaxID=3317338 RepID=UPI00360AF4A1